MLRKHYPAPTDVADAVKGRPVVFPILLWCELTGSSIDGVDFTPLWLFETLRHLGYEPTPAGFWWRRDLPTDKCDQLAAFVQKVDETYPDDE